jgi:methyl-accepting chemotaxis protein
MKLLHNISVIWKLNLVIVSVSAVVLLLATVSFLVQYQTEFQTRLVSEVEALAEVIAFSSAPALLFDDHAAARQNLSALEAKKNVVAACIYDRSGALFCSFTPKNKQQDIPASPSPDDEHYFDDRNMHLFRKIKINDDVVGTIYIRHDLEMLHQKRNQFFTIASTIFTSCLAIIVALSFFFQQIISRPILSLLGAVQKITREKNYEVRVEKKSTDEIGMLIDGFNEMVREIESRDKFLEDQVAERTAELKHVNVSLTQEIQERSLVELEREKLIAELKTALAEVKTLSGLLPICCSCKKIRDDQGYWNQIETYLQAATDAEFSHGICPDCAKKLYPEFCTDEEQQGPDAGQVRPNS